MHTLTVLYDARCSLCRRIRSWLETQPTYIDLAFVPAGSAEARRRFPELDHAATMSELTVISDEGAVYHEANAWLMCLWALRDYRAWSLRLSAPDMIPLARRFVIWVARNRSRLGTMLPAEVLSAVSDATADDLLGVDCADECRSHA
jgi:predicted DCC family thiol-disulfide oxidoreductase YuxK